MPGLLNNALTNYKAIFYKLAGRQEMKYITWPQLIKATNIFTRIAYDIFAQRKCQKIIQVSHHNNYLYKVKMKDYVIYYPKGADVNILGRTYYEIFNRHCGHFYDVAQTSPSENDIILDIGACEGLYALKHCGSVKKIYLFEPSRLMCECIALTLGNCDASGYEIMNLILAESDGTEVFFYEDADDPTMSKIVDKEEPSTYACRTVTIDSLLSSKQIDIPTIIKMDVQGAELAILRGAAAAIKEYKPRMAITTYHFPMDATNIINFCLKLRPDYHFILKGITTTEPIPRPTMVHLF
ncbi:MAG: FkbM family methyltransferase [Syntrophales bacterium]|nr:FkbM family methyltransferase [Syntrophales bacterium]